MLDFQTVYPDAGYLRLTYMLIDPDIVAVSPASVLRELNQSGRVRKAAPTGSLRMLLASCRLSPDNEHWHIDIAHINIHGTFYYLCAALDGASRFLIAWDHPASPTTVRYSTIPSRTGIWQIGQAGRSQATG